MTAPIRLSDWIADFCLAMAHRQELERLVAVFTAYFDESGTHAGAPVSAMAGFVGDQRQWRKFQKRTGKLFSRFRVNVFHAIDVRRGDNDFDGWSVDRKIEFHDEFQHIINETLEDGVVTFIRDDDYHYYRALNWPKKTRPDSKYTLMFRACLAHVIQTVGHIPQTIEPRLHVVLENGHNNAEDVRRSYNWVRERAKTPSSKRVLAGLAFANKDDCLPLAAADVFAYSAWGHRMGHKPIGIAKKPNKSDASYRGNTFWVDLDRASLNALHGQAIRIAAGSPASARPVFPEKSS